MQCYPYLNADSPTVEPAENFRLVRAADCNAQPVDWLWPGKIPIGKVTLLIGDPGTGKSLVALDIAARLSRGAPWPTTEDKKPKSPSPPNSSLDIRNSSFTSTPPSPLPTPPSIAPASVILLSASDDLTDTIRPRLDAACADSRRVFVLDSVADLRKDFDHLPLALNSAPNCRLIVIDPISAYVGSADCHFYSVVRKVLAPLASLAAERRIAVLAVANLRKASGAAIHRAAGSLGFVTSARAIWTVSIDDEDPNRRLFLPLKTNLGPAASGLSYVVSTDPTTGAPVITWHNKPIPTVHNPSKCAREYADLHPVRIWLRKALAGGPRSAYELATEAAQYGIQERTLRRALHAIGGHSQNRGGYDGWCWSLPLEDADDGSPVAGTQDTPQKTVP